MQAIYNGEKQIEIEQGDTRVIPNLDAAIMKENEGRSVSEAPTVRLPVEDIEDIQVKILDDSPYNTMNLQKELAEDMKRLMEGEEREPVWEGTEPVWQDSQNEDFVYGQEMEEGVSYNQEAVPGETDEESAEALLDGDEEEVINDTGEIFIEEEPEEEETDTDRITRSLMAPMFEETQEIPPVPDMEEIFFEDPNTTDLPNAQLHPEMKAALGDMEIEEVREPEEEVLEEQEDEAEKSPVYEEESSVSGVKKVIVPTVSGQGILKPPKGMMEPADFAVQKTGFDDMLSQEADGQISLVVPENEKVEKQITGQMSIQDILQEWEQMKKDKEAQLKNSVQKRGGDANDSF